MKIDESTLTEKQQEALALLRAAKGAEVRLSGSTGSALVRKGLAVQKKTLATIETGRGYGSYIAKT